MEIRVATKCKCGKEGSLSYQFCDDDIPPKGTAYECWDCDATWLAPPTMIDWDKIKLNTRNKPRV